MTEAAPDAAGFVLAGGRSQRMGRDKALTEIAGKPLAAHAVAIVRAAWMEVEIAGGSPALARHAPVIPDEAPDRGPLQGICSALRHTSAERAVFLPVDLPLLPPELIAYLATHARLTGRAVTLASLNGFAQTFPAVVRRDALPALEAELRAGPAGCYAAFRSVARQRGEPVDLLPVELLVQAGQLADPRGFPPFRWFFNVNTSDELARAAAFIA